jgi:hypothetical protein
MVDDASGEQEGNRDGDVVHGVPQGVQQGHPQEGPHQGTGHPEGPAARLPEQHAAEDRRPQTVPERGEHAAQQLGLEETGQGHALKVSMALKA